MEGWNLTDKQLPYNPGDVDIRQQTFIVGDILWKIKYNEVELWREDVYQRRSNAWTLTQRSRLIESLIMRIPLPIFYFDGSESPWKIIDGLHRLTTLYTFIEEDQWELKDLEFLTEYEGFKYSELPFRYQRAIQQSTIEAYIINPGTPKQVKFNIFQRINTGGTSLSRQEIRNAYYGGLATDFINELSKAPEFLNATNYKISTHRMKDKEWVLRFVAFYKFIELYAPPLEKFLDKTMEIIPNFDHELSVIKSDFIKSMNLCGELFGDTAFYTLNVKGEKLGSNVNIALFETWSVNLAKLSDCEAKNVLSNKSLIVFDFIKLLQDIDFYKSISASTSGKKAVITRFMSIESLIKQYK
ncbi:DUF262 domain-containing protein [Runella rosea]|uniref:DUF262 domain-containing protein n=1 Tax=Runella rosea TaxID=2259595 RepID=A0A344TDH2_9BACT|nr:DUF262 domain-containing protein [Runella rosea]AXE16693.1 DUF262 domain-containing protein [Runella rosea]